MKAIARIHLASVKPFAQGAVMANKFVPYGSKGKNGGKPSDKDGGKFGGLRSGKKSKLRR